jgi:hypothetical protein
MPPWPRGALLDRNAACRLLRLSRRFGEEIAIAAGLETAIGDYVVVVSPAVIRPRRFRDGRTLPRRRPW